MFQGIMIYLIYFKYHISHIHPVNEDLHCSNNSFQTKELNACGISDLTSQLVVTALLWQSIVQTHKTGVSIPFYLT